jgi:hypothetical protein|tara:strand:- start:133 stop:612 length:480 start_codon:yes stop_codon:yes gene_type:complete
MADNLIRNYAENNQINSVPQHDIVDNIMNNDIAVDETQMTESMNELMLEEFKKNVQTWMNYDNQMKRLAAASKLLKTKKKEINEKILDFMARYNIEDLNTKEGVIRYKKTFVKEPLTQKMIKDKLNELFKNNENDLNRVNEIFNNRQKVEKTSLRRLKL